MTMPRRLDPDDTEMFAVFRREMLLNSPWAFGSSPEDDRFRDLEALRAGLASGDTTIFAARDAENGRILATAGLVRDSKIKRSHIAMIWGVYVTPAARGRGLGRSVVSAAIDAARQWNQPPIAMIVLTVSQNAPEARRLYESLGFIAWGVEPDALRVAGVSYSETYMHLRIVR